MEDWVTRYPYKRMFGLFFGRMQRLQACRPDTLQRWMFPLARVPL